MYRRSTTVKYVLAAIVGAVMYCEWFIYLVQPQYWTEMECTNDHDRSCTKILFIADPQIQGEEAVERPLSTIFNWDSDRFLKSTFRVAVDYFKPDVLVYLGDLMDEGSISTFQQFHGYVERLADIFVWNYPAVQVWLPGDNDIGGEHELVHRSRVEEFEKTFSQQKVITYSNVSFYVVNAITYTFPDKTDEPPGAEHNFKIAVSHYPITMRVMFAQNIMKKINPQIFFCAHDHESKYVKQHKDLTHKVTTWFNAPKSTLNINFDDDSLYEIYVPTCSYRMGTSFIGFGAAILENNFKSMRYTVFWSPTRFPYLYFYLGILVALLVYGLVFCVAQLFFRRFRLSKKKSDMSPLLERI
ncbi:hypothetical protein PYW08_000713 [Mythimna loreyi]|uniref:Uncharacterized protein n=1 Tax=Mythimna loreyi TaxID=667449 RepID=A0ACC2R0E9_9NEOP|nr:hypothetical protein PYW08_000713 [Mythimna loreyi]